MYGRESWTIKKSECWRIHAIEQWCWRRLLSPLDCKEIQSVHPKENQSWMFIRRTDAETLKLWPPDAKNWLIWKDPDSGKDWRQEENGMAEDEMVRCITNSIDMSLSKLWELVMAGKPGVLQSMESQRAGHNWATELNWIKVPSLFTVNIIIKLLGLMPSTCVCVLFSSYDLFSSFPFKISSPKLNIFSIPFCLTIDFNILLQTFKKCSSTSQIFLKPYSFHSWFFFCFCIIYFIYT